MNYHLILTDQCNLCCTYCRGRVGKENETSLDNASLDDSLPLEFSCSMDALAAFLVRDPRPSLTFYGGEPLLRSDLIGAIMEQMPWVKYLLHTNGTLLNQLDTPILQHLQSISVSLDGPESLTDRNRGVGVYRKVMRNIRSIQERGFQGELIARMTVPVKTDIPGAVHHLARNADHSFSSIHWQLDADFSQQNAWEEYRSWIENEYNPGIQELIHDWVDMMEKTGTVLRWYPFIDPMQDMLSGRKSPLRCGCGHENYGILTHGAIVPCPLMVGVKEYYIGHISSTHPKDLPKYCVGGRCTGCRIRDFCGGRCLYSSVMGHWSEEQKDLICETVHNLHDGLQEVLPVVQDFLEKGVIENHDLDHPRYEGCEIIP